MIDLALAVVLIDLMVFHINLNMKGITTYQFVMALREKQAVQASIQGFELANKPSPVLQSADARLGAGDHPESIDMRCKLRQDEEVHLENKIEHIDI